MRKIIREPLVHFLFLGIFLFLIYGMVNTEQNKNEIIIDDNLINEFVAKWELKRNRPPNIEELTGLVDQYVEQELLYREALLMNLDHNDEIVKRRLAQKMEFISDDLAETLQPTKEMLLAYYEEHKENYKRTSVYSLKLTYFSEDKRSNAFEDAKASLQLVNPEVSGDNISLTNEYADASALKIARDYGSDFVNSLDSLPVGEWTGPIYSGFGVHIVNISNKKPNGYFSFEEVLIKVNIDYNFEASNEFKKELVKTLLANYSISISVKNKELKKELDEKF